MAYYEDYYSAGIKRRFVKYKGISNGSFIYGETSVAEGVDKVKQNLLTLLTVNQGDVFFNPSFGSSLEQFLFEANDFILRDTIDRYIRTQVGKYLSDVTINEVIIKSNNIYVLIQIKYYINSIGYYDEVDIIKKRGVSFD